MRAACGTFGAIILSVLGFVHWYWAGGGQRGIDVAVPERDGAPLFRASRAAVATIGVLLNVAAAIVLGALGMLGGSWVTNYFRVAAAGLFSLFLIRTIGDFRYCGLTRQVRTTRFAHYDRVVFTPLCLFLTVLLAVVVFGN